jgi:glyoxylase-like metal-dependent hydrolase (beta-lactamase superfamily II)
MVHVHTVGAFQENCYLRGKDGELAVFDPGDEADRLIAAIDATGLAPKYELLTHAHLDHVGAAAALQARYGAPVYMMEAESPLLENLPLQCAMFGVPPIPAPTIDRHLQGGERLPFGAGEIHAVPTPGHSPGGVTYVCDGHAFVGDTIFAGGVGRTDLWGGSWPVLEATIQTHIFTLPEEVTLYPGHGPTTTVGTEKRSNPFFN